MGIYIKGFKPQDGLYVIKDGVIRKYKGNGGTVRPYELVEVKEPHGRLIDADEIVKDLRHDVAVDQDMLDYEELTDVIRETTHADKDIKQNAAEIIESLPTVQFEERTKERTETHAMRSDTISRQAARETFCALCNGKRFGDCEYSNTCQSLRALQCVPPTEPERPKGEWRFIGNNMFECSSCRVAYTTEQLDGLRNYASDPYAPKFCPNCGCDMRMKGADDEDN